VPGVFLAQRVAQVDVVVRGGVEGGVGGREEGRVVLMSRVAHDLDDVLRWEIGGISPLLFK
jgi:hypothetical protein